MPKTLKPGKMSQVLESKHFLFIFNVRFGIQDDGFSCLLKGGGSLRLLKQQSNTTILNFFLTKLFFLNLLVFILK